MSFSGGSTFDTGTLVASFKIDATSAKASIENINQQATQIKNAFGNVVFKLDASQSQAAIQQLTAATTAFKAAQTQATQALTEQRTALTGTKTALDQQKIATEAARTATAQARQEITQFALAEKQAAQAAQSAAASTNIFSRALNSLKTGLSFGAGLEVFRGLKDIIGGIGDSAIGMNAKLEQSQVAFTAITGSAQTATTLVGQLEQIASHSTFGLAQLQAASQQMLAFGVNVKNVPPLIQAVQNAAAASGGDIQDKFQRIGYVISELSSGMKLSERQLRQLAMAGVPLTALAEQLGTTVAKLQEAGKTGEFTSAQIVGAFAAVYTHGRLGDFMNAQAQTFSGAMSIIKTNLSLATAQAFQPLFKVVSDLAVKFAEFVQTPTFNQWVAQIQQGVAAVIAIFKELASILGPIAKAIADLFGFKTGNIQAEMDAVKNMKVNVGEYDAAINGAAADTALTAQKTAEWKKTIDDASRAILGINADLAANKVLLDDNAQAIARVKNEYDPLIKSAEAHIKAINLLSPEELRRKQDELNLDKQRAALELTKPDLSGYDSRILADRNALDTMPSLDTSGLDSQMKSARDAISSFDMSSYTGGIQSKIEKLQDSDPAAGVKGQIASLQEAISALNTQPLDDKIQALKDKLAEPAPDTNGFKSQLVELAAQIETTTDAAARAALVAQYSSIAGKKDKITFDYQTSQTSGKTELKGLEAQRADQRLANTETARADRARIEDLKEQQKIIEAAKAATMADLRDQLSAATARGEADRKGLEARLRGIEAEKVAAEKAYAANRKTLEDNLHDEELARTNALAPYEAAMKRISDAQARNSALDAAAAAQRKLDLAPYEASLVSLRDKEAELLAPLEARKQYLDEITKRLQEQKAIQEGARAQAKQDEADWKAGAAERAKARQAEIDDFKRLHDITGITGPGGVSPYDEVMKGVGNGTAEDSPIVKQLKDIRAWLENHKTDITDLLKTQWDLAVKDVQDFVDAISKIFKIGQDLWKHDWDSLWKDLGVIGKLAQDIQRGDWGSFWYDIGLLQTNGSEASEKSLDQHLGNLGATQRDHHKTWLNDRDTFYGDLHLKDSKYYGDFGLLVTDALQKIGEGISTWWTHQTETWGNGFSDLGSAVKEAIGKDGKITKFFRDWPNLITDALKGLDNLIGAPFQNAWKTLGNFFDKVSGAMGWLAKTFHIPPFDPYKSSAAGATQSGSDPAGAGSWGVPGNAKGTKDWRGGLSWVGEQGPELMYVPQHAVIVPHQQSQQIAGFAGGLNFDDIGSFVSGIGGLFKAGTSAVVDKVMSKLPDPGLDGILAGAGTALVKEVKDGMLGWLGHSPDNRAPSSGRAGGASGGGALGPLAGLIRDAASRYGIPADIIGAIILHESGGIIGRTEVGGGQGRGLMQVDGGTWPQAYDPRMSGTSIDDAAYQIDVGAMILKQAFDAAGGDVAGALTGYAGGGFAGVHGRTFYQELLDMGLIGQADAALAGGGAAVRGGFSGAGGGWTDVVNAAMARNGQFFQDNGQQWYYWCEKFVNDMDEAAGLGAHRAATAIIHANSLALQSGMAPAGASLFWEAGDTWSPYGHTAIALGDGSNVIGTTSNGIGITPWEGAPGYMGWAPPGLADGGLTIGGNPFPAMVGDGPAGEREWHMPEPKLAEVLSGVLRRESGGTTISIGDIYLTAPESSDPRDFGRRVRDAVNDELAQHLTLRGH